MKNEGLRFEGPFIFLPDISAKRKHAIDRSNKTPTISQVRKSLREDAELTIQAVVEDLNGMRGLDDLTDVVVGGSDCAKAHAKFWEKAGVDLASGQS